MKIAVIVIAILIIGGAGLGFTALGIKNNIEEMKTQDVLFLVTGGEDGGDGKNMEDVQVAIGIIMEQKAPVVINPADIQGAYASSGPVSLIGEKLQGFPLSGDSFDKERPFQQKTAASFQRVVTVDASVIGDIVEGVGGVELRFEGGDFKLSKDMTKKEVMTVLTGDGLSGSGTWTITIVNPFTGKDETREMDGDELETLAKTFNIGLDTWAIKIAVLGGVGDRVGKMDDASQKEAIKTLINAYKDGRIKTYPSNSVTRLAKFAPTDTVVDKLIGG